MKLEKKSMATPYYLFLQQNSSGLQNNLHLKSEPSTSKTLTSFSICSSKQDGFNGSKYVSMLFNSDAFYYVSPCELWFGLILVYLHSAAKCQTFQALII